jgi:hypothetical protein
MRFRAQLSEYYISFTKKGITDIKSMAQTISEKKNNIDLTVGTIVKYLYEIRRENKNVITVTNQEDWIVKSGNYLFEYKGSRKKFSIALIDEIFLFYVRKGYNFSRSKIQQKFNLTPRSFAVIQNKFNLSKESDLFSPYTKQNTSKEELEILTEQLMQKVINSGEMTSQRYDEALNRKYRSIINKENLDVTWKQDVISELISDYPNCETLQFNRFPKNTEYRYKEICVNITDLHGGSKAENMKITKDWSIEKLEEKLDRVARIANSYKAEKVHLNILGDLVETVSGINHPDSWKLVQDGHFGSKTIIETKNLLVRFINKLNNVYSINGVGGNHDRLQASNKLADTGATDLIFEMIKERVKLTNSPVEVNYDPIILPLSREGFGEILIHGDKGLHKRSVEFLILHFAKNPKDFQFINAGHLHSFQVNKDDAQEKGRRVVFPSIITGNYFSDIEIGKSDKSGFGITCINMFGEPDLIIHNI